MPVVYTSCFIDIVQVSFYDKLTVRPNCPGNIMIDKNATINAAQRFASNGEIDNAIAEWEKLLKNGKDGNVHNTIGDLYLKKGSQAQAVEAFTKAAEIFRKAGFDPKAIAIYKKILNILPNNVESIMALATLNATKGLNANAANYYFRAADIYHRNNLAEKATMVIEKILKLSITDLATRIKIADWYIKAGLKPRAANEYAAIASSYLSKDDPVTAKKYFTRATELDPDNISLFIGLSRLAEKTGDIELAFKHLKDSMSRDPNSKETQMAYSELAIRSNKIDDAKKALLKLIEETPSYNPPRKLLGGLYLDENELQKAWEQLLPCIDDAINGKDWPYALAMLNNFRELHPAPARERLIDVYNSAEDIENLVKELKELASLYEKQGLNDDALRVYKELLKADPNNPEAAAKIKEIKPIMPIEEAIKKATPLTEALLEKKAEANFFAKQGLKEEAMKIYKEILKSSPNNTEIKKKIEELQATSGRSKEAKTKNELDTGSATEDLQGIFDKFSNNEDFEAHYNAGLECKQEGHLDEAIKEFKIAAKDPAKKLVSKSMTALCYMGKGAYADAVTEFTHIIEAMSPEDASYTRIKYELAWAYQKNGNETRALELYSEIKEQAPDFKDINSRIEDVMSTIKNPKTKPETKTKPKKKNRVSYI